MPTRQVSLTDHFDNFIESGIKSGRFSDASEVVREALRLLEQRESEHKAKLEWLRGAAHEGFEAADSGDYVVLRSERDIDALLSDIHKEAEAEPKLG